MPIDHLRYDILAQNALRGMVRGVLADAARKGLPGEHHFFISFDTRADGVRMSPRLREQYPDEMTVVLQHQFWDLKVHEDSFEVGLSFNGNAEKLLIPFAAIKSFVDPSVQFALQFERVTETQDNVPPVAVKADKEPGKPRKTGKQEPRKSVPSVPRVPAPAPAPAALAPAKDAPKDPAKLLTDDKPDKPDKPKRAGGGEVVRLDRFRKK